MALKNAVLRTGLTRCHGNHSSEIKIFSYTLQFTVLFSGLRPKDVEAKNGEFILESIRSKRPQSNEKEQREKDLKRDFQKLPKYKNFQPGSFVMLDFPQVKYAYHENSLSKNV